MRFLKKYEKFNEELVDELPATKPRKPGIKPGIKPGKRDRPTPIKKDKPSVNPAPKAKLPTSTDKVVVNRFINLLNEEGGDIKKYVER